MSGVPKGSGGLRKWGNRVFVVLMVHREEHSMLFMFESPSSQLLLFILGIAPFLRARSCQRRLRQNPHSRSPPPSLGKEDRHNQALSLNAQNPVSSSPIELFF